MAPRSKAPIVICNHRGPWEAIALASIAEMSFISSDANFKMPIFGNLFTVSQAVEVNRNDDQSKVAVEKEILRRARDDKWNRVALFPEGTCGNGTALMAFRLGAFTPALPIQPVVVDYPFDPQTGIDPSWAGFDVGLVNLTMRLMSQPSNKLTVRFLDVVKPSMEESVKPILYCSRVREIMAKALGVSLTPHGVDDTLIQLEAIRLKLKPEDVVLGMASVRLNHQFTVEDVKSALNIFKSMDFDGNGEIDYAEFSRAMCVPESDNLRDVWETFTQGAPTLNTRAYIYSSIRVLKEMSSARFIIAAFEHIDVNKDDNIDFDEWVNFLRTASPDVSEAQALRVFRRMDKDHTGRLDVFDFGTSLRERPTWMVFCFMMLCKSDSSDATKARALLSEINKKCSFKRIKKKK
eukprot:Nk52_evm33s2612 gene=Nk52_evmTU33s2612